MTGPEHYQEAERLLGKLDLLREALNKTKGDAAIFGIHMVNGVIAEIQVHATLAVAAATAELDAFGDGGAATGRAISSRSAWDGVLS